MLCIGVLQQQHVVRKAVRETTISNLYAYLYKSFSSVSQDWVSGNLTKIQGEASFTQRLFLRPGCQGNEFVAEFLQCIINTLLNEEKILMDFFCDLKFLLINWLNYMSLCVGLVMPQIQHFWGKLEKPLENFGGPSKSVLSSNSPFI